MTLKGILHEGQDRETDYTFDKSQTPTADGSSLLFTQAAPVERLEMFSSLPPRPEVDRLIFWFFDPQAFLLPIPFK
jgi:hypothetical protein